MDTQDYNETVGEVTEEQSEESEKYRDVAIPNARHLIHCLSVIGQIEGHYILPPQNKTTKYEHIMPALVAIEQDTSIEGLIIIINTVGGDVEAGLALAELISSMKTPTVKSATMTIHPVRLTGLVLGVPQTLSYFEKMQERIVRFVTDNSRISPERFKELMLRTGELVMDVGSVLTGEDAVREGIIDSVGGLSEAIECLYGMIEGR